jgi:hypothetical protein
MTAESATGRLAPQAIVLQPLIPRMAYRKKISADYLVVDETPSPHRITFFGRAHHNRNSDRLW